MLTRPPSGSRGSRSRSTRRAHPDRLMLAARISLGTQRMSSDTSSQPLATGTTVQPMIWSTGGLRLLDQRRLPQATEWIDCDSAAAVAEAIRSMAVRGAPAIGIAAAFGIDHDAERGGDAGRLEAEAQAILVEDVTQNRRIGEFGAALLPHGARVLTHCWHQGLRPRWRRR